MPDNNTSETNFNFAEQVRQDRIVDLMKIEEQINLKNGTYDPSPEAYQECLIPTYQARGCAFL